jgi:hypothetical protein
MYISVLSYREVGQTRMGCCVLVVGNEQGVVELSEFNASILNLWIVCEI